jgi:L-lactate dehydrogenase complex protein LldG
MEKTPVSARDLVLTSVRSALGVTGQEATRRLVVADRLREHPRGVVPKRGQLAPAERTALFAEMMTAAAGNVEHVRGLDAVPSAVANFLRRHNLPLSVRRGEDARLTALPWKSEAALEVTVGPSDGKQLASVSHAFAGVAETGTLVLASGADNPTTLNFLPDNHIVVLDARDIEADFENVFARLRACYGERQLPRVVNMITGPSRSADIEQTLILGAHGPRRLLVIIVGEAS